MGQYPKIPQVIIAIVLVDTPCESPQGDLYIYIYIYIHSFVELSLPTIVIIVGVSIGWYLIVLFLEVRDFFWETLDEKSLSDVKTTWFSATKTTMRITP